VYRGWFLNGYVLRGVCVVGVRAFVFFCVRLILAPKKLSFFSLSKLFVSLYGTGKGARFYTELGYECVTHDYDHVSATRSDKAHHRALTKNKVGN